MFRKVLTAAAGVVLLSVPAQAYVAHNDMQVSGPPSGFEVKSRGGAGASAFWCAAGEYAGQALGLAPTDRIWRISPTPRAAGEGITFATAPAAAVKTGLVLLSADDGSMSVAAAEQGCWGNDDF